MLVSAIASSVSLRKSLSLTGSSPAASRWALTAIRRYLATVTPGMATGYWKAMNRPIRERSSGEASVMSSPLKLIVPSVTSSAGGPMITLARVDLPEPLGPISAWTLPFSTSRSRPRRISLSSTLTCRLRISSSANFTPFLGLESLASDGRADRCLSLGAAVRAAEGNQLGQRGAREGFGHAALHAHPQQLGRTGVVPVVLVRAEHFAVGRVVKALHRRDLPFERLDHGVHGDLLRRFGQAVAAVRSPGRGDQAGLAQLRDQVLEVGERQ